MDCVSLFNLSRVACRGFEERLIEICFAPVYFCRSLLLCNLNLQEFLEQLKAVGGLIISKRHPGEKGYKAKQKAIEVERAVRVFVECRLTSLLQISN